MGERIKSAYEKALERAASVKLESADLKKLEYFPQGQSLAAKFLRERDFDLLGALKSFKEEDLPYVREGMEETFLQNIQLPRDEEGIKTSQKALQGLLLLKKDKSKLRKIIEEIEYLFSYYLQAQQQIFHELKEEMGQRLAGAQEALERQLGMKVNIQLERQPFFQEEWLRRERELSSQYEALLNEKKEKIRRLM